MKAFFFDYDGTLVDDETKEVGKGTMEALHALKRQGHFLFLNTGRTQGILDTQIEQFSFDGKIMGCGTHVMFGKETLLCEDMNLQDQRNIETILKEEQVDAFFEGKDHLYISEHIQHPYLMMLLQRYRQMPISIKPITEEGKSYSKLFLCFTNAKCQENVKRALAPYVTYIERGEDRAELVKKGFSKATGIQLIIDKLCITKEDCYVFGDSNNDLPMFEFIKQSILIGSEAPSLSNRVMLCSDSAKEDGIAKALRKLQLL